MARVVRALRPLLVVVVLVTALVAGLLVGLNTDSGRALVAERIAQVAPRSGLRITVGRLEGRPLSSFVARDIALADLDGVFATIPELTVDWRPLRFAQGSLVVNDAVAPTVHLLRRPRLRPGDPDAPLLPDFDIAVGRLAVARLVVEPAVAGRRQVLALEASADIADGRARVRARAGTQAGDRLRLTLDAVPDEDRFDVDARLEAPVGGLIAGLAGLDRPLTLVVAGEGAWSRWRGRLAATLAGAPVATLALAADDGRFTLTGPVRPAAIIPAGIVARLTGPVTRLDLTLTPDDDRLRLALRARSPALALTANVETDRRLGEIGSSAISGRLLEPAALLPSARGTPIDFAAAATGPVGAPNITFNARAALLAVSGTGLVEPRLRGSARLGRGPIVVPVLFTATRVTGLGPELGELATAIRVEGPVRVAGLTLAADRLTVRTTRVTARAAARVDLATGGYVVTLNGQLPRYAVAGLGVVDATADLRVVPGPGERGLAVSGPFRARVVRLDQAALRRLAGGLPVVSGRFAYGPDGRVGVPAFRLSAPRLQLAGEASYQPGGAIRARATGRSADYGPVVATVAGTAARPSLDLALARPGLGLGLAGVRATVRPAPGGFALSARGRSSYGPLTADATLLTAPNGPVLELDAATIAGITARGRLRQTPTAIAGALTLRAPGLTGALLLDEAERLQRARLTLVFDDARLPALDPTLTIGAGEASAVVLLRPAGPSVNATARLARVRRGDLLVSRASLQGSLRDGVGGVRADIAGEAQAPFTLTAAAGITPERITVNANGRVADEAVRLIAPAVVTRVDGVWRLAPATLAVADGRATIAGSYGRELSATATLANLSLDSLSALGALAVTGQVSGRAELTIPPSGLPTGSARFTIRRLSRANLAVASLPVEIEAAAAIRGTSAAGRGYIRREGRVIGAFQAQLTPIPGDAGDPIVERLLAAPVRGQVRLQAPAEALWPLAGVDALDVRGPVAATASISGRLGEPVVRGIIRTDGARLEVPALGAVVTDIALDGAFDGPRLVVRSVTGRAGDGRLAGSGQLAFTAASGLTADLQATLDNAQLIRLDILRAAATGPARIRLDRLGGVISGDLDITRARLALGGAAAETVLTLAVREVGTLPNGRIRPETAPTRWRLAVDASANNRVEVTGLGLASEWSADVEISGEATQPRISGRAQLVRGEYDFAGKTFRLERGDIRFQNEYPPNPEVDIQATARVTDLTAQINIRGSALRPEISFTSVPALPEDEVLSRLLFGTSVTNLSAPEALQLAAAVAQLRGGGGGGFNPVTALRRVTGLDRLRVAGADPDSGRGTTVSAGKYIGDSIYVELATDARGYTATQIEWTLTRSLSILSSVASAGGNRVSVRLSRDY